MMVFIQAEGMDLGQLNAQQVSDLIELVGTTRGVSTGSFLPQLIASIIFGTIGLFAFMHGKRIKDLRPMVIGGALMGYPYVVSGTFWVIAVGAALCVALYLWRG